MGDTIIVAARGRGILSGLLGPGRLAVLLVFITFVTNLYRRRRVAQRRRHTSTTVLVDETERLENIPVERDGDGTDRLDQWGFNDAGFFVNEEGHVVMAGARYPEICGLDLPYVIPRISATFNLSIPTLGTFIPQYPPAIPALHRSDPLEDALTKALRADQLSWDGKTRLRHGHGHTLSEMYNIKVGSIGLARVPDLVAFPESIDNISSLITIALAHSALLVPYGGGTNVTQALACSTDEQRVIISVDMSRMNRILWLDTANGLAHVEAGAVGRHLEKALNGHGFTLGHEPDSMEFSTLGGWVATNASGMKKNKYGNIENIVQDVTVITPKGVISRTGLNPRESTGSDVRHLLFGSEGKLGFIVSAVVRVSRLPQKREHGSYLFPTFEDGAKFMYDVSQSDMIPASIRLVDNDQFQLSHCLRPAENRLKTYVSSALKLMLRHVYGFDFTKISACTLLFEGSREEVARQKRVVHRLASLHSAIRGGAEAGKRGYKMTFAIAYLRDFLLNFNVAGESFETSVSWSQALSLCTNVKRRIREEFTRRKLPGVPHISCRLTQVYQTGVAIYFYFAIPIVGVEKPMEVYAELEHAARDEVLKCGGSLSHHHGVGNLRKEFLPSIMSDATMELRQRTKDAFDPSGVFMSL
ncbi:hypothetical protein JAAARDRAFT_202310 [Jaapia argillacea MUCL 33604]|uniref:Alkylglycerone-phosphate synthase n=1 Tax=Jaapia argillacea MUCL 33604 TaxID=933084 RepID=A0A067QFW3_9AGAM|nr:hypothetical protein JAAARDRAFT_202310 [Jaapia argillacea MUCL 33604]